MSKINIGKPDMLGYCGDLEVAIWYDFQPFEESTHNYPGCNPEVTVTCVQYNGCDITDGVGCDKDEWDSVEDQAMEHAENRGEPNWAGEVDRYFRAFVEPRAD